MLGYGRGMTESRLFGYGSILLEEAESRFRTEAVEREARLIVEAKERFMKLTEI
ncbi:hypothetical protein Gohar_017293 [Gossypium harknessii]|uniref:Uncharacterized protein n=1 Tax=Gossypium harknessii TaxID=34285 RepID=A0A7J9G651_9ROSI|nr:hypothetical protein [Gossypium harknessii]